MRRILQPIVMGLFVGLWAPGMPTVTLAAPGRGLAPPTTAPSLGKPGCRPNCRGRICGGDGCGGSCGVCAKNHFCQKNRCVKGVKDPCVRMAGRWKGEMVINPVHRVDGRVSGTAKACKARLRISFHSRGRTAWVVQDFTITFKGAAVTFRGRRIVANGSGSGYSLDTFTGRLNASRTRFRGTLRDTQNVTGPVLLNRK